MLAVTVNSCNFSGHLVAKPTLREVAGKALATFAPGQTRRYKKPDGTMAESTVFVDCELWSDRARTLVEKTDKSRAILLQDARLKQDRWEAEGKAHSRLLLLVSQWQFADGVRPAKPQEGGQQAARTIQPPRMNCPSTR